MATTMVDGGGFDLGQQRCGETRDDNDLWRNEQREKDVTTLSAREKKKEIRILKFLSILLIYI